VECIILSSVQPKLYLSTSDYFCSIILFASIKIVSLPQGEKSPSPRGSTEVAASFSLLPSKSSVSICPTAAARSTDLACLHSDHIYIHTHTHRRKKRKEKLRSLIAGNLWSVWYYRVLYSIRCPCPQLIYKQWCSQTKMYD